MVQEDPEFLSKVITADETWLHHFDPESKQQSSVWKSPSLTPPKSKNGFFCRESYGHLIFYIDGMVYQYVVPAHTAATGLYYRDVMKVLQDHIRRKWPRLSATSWMMHHDNARPNVAKVVAEYLAQINRSASRTLPIVRI